MEEYQIWTLWSSNRIADGLNFVATVLLIWLAIRVAAATRASDETNLFGKLVSSAFGLAVLGCLLYTSPSPRDGTKSRMPSSA